jgi:hypothetical protein
VTDGPLLIVRELLDRGACRYTDLRNGLVGAGNPDSSNVVAGAALDGGFESGVSAQTLRDYA